MFKKKWMKVLAIILSVIVLLGVGGLFAANYAVDKLMNSMVDSFDVDLSSTEQAGNLDTTPADITEPVVAPTDSSEQTADSLNPEGSISGESSTVNKEQPAKTSAGDKAAAATAKPAADGYTAQVSTDKAKQIKESVTVKDKADVASIVLGELSMADIKRLQELAQGGLSIEEKREARRIILGKVSEEQYNELSQIAKKYGVSQGKTRDQVITEEQGSE